MVRVDHLIDVQKFQPQSPTFSVISPHYLNSQKKKKKSPLFKKLNKNWKYSPQEKIKQNDDSSETNTQSV